MKKKIKRILTYLVEGAGFGSAGTEEHERMASRETFDEAGNSVELITYDNRGDEQERMLRKYDEKGRIVAELSEDKLTTSYDKWTATYDDVANTSEEIQFYGDEPGERTETRFDGVGNPLEIKKFDSEGELESRVVYGYDDKGRCVSEEEYDASALVQRTLTTYDHAGERSGQVVMYELSPEDNQVIKYTHTDETDIEEVFDLTGNLLRRHTHKADAKGRDVEAIYENTVDPSKVGGWTRQYDDQDREILYEHLDASGDLLMRGQRSWNEGLLQEEATFDTAVYRGIASSTIKRFRYEFYE